MNLKGLKYYVALVLLASSSCLMAQKKMVDDHKLDSLTFADRISLRTNGIDWLMLLPNIGIEFDLNRYNWSRNAIALNVKGNWNTKHTFSPGMVYNLFEVRAEYRNYWRTRKLSEELGRHRHTYEKILSGRRRHPKHPLTTWYRGAYLSYDDYSFLTGKEGKQGKGITLGFTYGIIRPLYIFPSGKSVDLDFGFSAGFCVTDYEKFAYDSQSASYYRTEAKDGWGLIPYPVLTEARVGLVYRLGTMPIYNKYRWRFDVDMAYRDKVLAELEYRAKLREADMRFMEIYRYYQDRYDSILILNMKNHESYVNEKLADTRDMKRKADQARQEQAIKLQEKAREQQRQERIKQQQAQALQDSIDMVDKANTKKMEEEVQRKLDAQEAERKKEIAAEKKADALEKEALKKQAEEQKAIDKQIAEEQKKYDSEKRQRMNEAYAIQRQYDAEQKAAAKAKAAKEEAARKERLAQDKAWQKQLDAQEKAAQKKREEALRKQSQVLDAAGNVDAAKTAEAAKAAREAAKRAKAEAKAAAKKAKENAKKGITDADDDGKSEYNPED